MNALAVRRMGEGVALGEHEGEVEHRLKQLQGIDALVVRCLPEHQPELLSLLARAHAIGGGPGLAAAAGELEVVNASCLHARLPLPSRLPVLLMAMCCSMVLCHTMI